MNEIKNNTMTIRNTFGIILLLLISSFKVTSQTVQTQYGPVTGHLNETVLEFLGIPFASPPVDTLRWSRPVEPVSWVSPIIADSFPPACPQKSYEQGAPDSVFTLEGEEDCLYLNIWTPDTNASLPVMVFIHGGGNQQGSTGQISGGTTFYRGKNLSSRGNVVVVTIQYRLGVLGYLVHPGLEEENPEHVAGNYGIMDQIFALQWIQNNIASFGGDPGNVTLFGESAGGLDIGNLLTTQQASGLFHKAVIQSAGPVLGDYGEALNEGILFVDGYISSGSDAAKIAYMRTVDPDSITIKMTSPMPGGVAQMNWGPVMDNFLFNDYPMIVVQTGNYNKVPLLMGSNSEEMSLAVFGYPDFLFPQLVDSIINTLVPPALQPMAHQLYPSSPPDVAKQSYIGILTDTQFTCSARRTTQCVGLNQEEPVWRYFFTHKHTFAGGEALGSYHGMELFYVFNTWEDATLGSGLLFKPEDDSVQQVMLGYWVNFAASGNPNGAGLPEWIPYQPSNDPYMELKATPDGSGTGLRTEKCDLWDNVAGFTGCTSSLQIDEGTLVHDIILYPNPVKGMLHVNPGPGVIEFDINVYNPLGQRVISTVSSNSLDLSGQPCGIYFVEIRVGNKIHKKKIIRID